MASLTNTASITSRGTNADLCSDAFISAAKEKIRLTRAEETCLASLFCRVQDTRSSKPILGDSYAYATLKRCDLDQSRTTFSAGQHSGNVVWASHRALMLDTWCEEFILAHEEPVTVLHLACGLDCRYLRIRDRLRTTEKKPEIRVSEILVSAYEI